MFGGPSCPNCGSKFFVQKIRTGGIFFGHTLDPYDLHRCYRCFTKFSPSDEPGERERAEPHASLDPDEPARIAEVEVDLEEAGTKLAVEEFAVTVENVSQEPLHVDRILLRFDDGEQRATSAKEVIDPGDTARIEIHRSWIYADQHVVSVEVRSGGETLATAKRDVTAVQ